MQRINEKVYAFVEEAEKKIAGDLARVDAVALTNQAKVLNAFHEFNVGQRHFAQTNGYGYDDIGRDTLASVFAYAFGAESAVGIRVLHRDGREDRILSSDSASCLCRMGSMEARAAYALWSGSPQAEACLLFLGSGRSLEVPGVLLESAAGRADVLLEKRGGKWRYSASGPCRLELFGQEFRLEASSRMSDLPGEVGR